MVYGVYLGVEGGPVSLLWGLCMYGNDTWTLWGAVEGMCIAGHPVAQGPNMIELIIKALGLGGLQKLPWSDLFGVGAWSGGNVTYFTLVTTSRFKVSGFRADEPKAKGNPKGPSIMKVHNYIDPKVGI